MELNDIPPKLLNDVVEKVIEILNEPNSTPFSTLYFDQRTGKLYNNMFDHPDSLGITKDFYPVYNESGKYVGAFLGSKGFISID